MIVLLDTNAFIWWIADNTRLGVKARAVIANPKNSIYVSNLSLFECSIKVRLGRLRIDFDAVDNEFSEGQLLELRYDTLSAKQFANQQSLPQSDPFDVAMVAQAIAKHMTLITSDGHILEASLPGLYSIDATK